jgi:hypothetical protein
VQAEKIAPAFQCVKGKKSRMMFPVSAPQNCKESMRDIFDPDSTVPHLADTKIINIWRKGAIAVAASRDGAALRIAVESCPWKSMMLAGRGCLWPRYPS